jgi:hypothetical protein
MLEPLGPFDERFQEASQSVAGLFIHEVARLLVELLTREGDKHLRIGHHVGGSVQENLMAATATDFRSLQAPQGSTEPVGSLSLDQC